eukprot:Phypoly_transcript_13626.p1 GENE.Phypoly_transcript_13626~~Phypoly_transcript_13626.p1  ORF type:complete len:190 (-),score=6.79 Phypoly_transcript_13626:17-586(-)
MLYHVLHKIIPIEDINLLLTLFLQQLHYWIQPPTIPPKYQKKFPITLTTHKSITTILFTNIFHKTITNLSPPLNLLPIPSIIFRSSTSNFQLFSNAKKVSTSTSQNDIRNLNCTFCLLPQFKPYPSFDAQIFLDELLPQIQSWLIHLQSFNPSFDIDPAMNFLTSEFNTVASRIPNIENINLGYVSQLI